MIELFSDQKELLNDLRHSIGGGNRRVMVQAETGLGKTIISAEMIASANRKGKRCAFVVPRKELLRQTAKTFNDFGIDFSYVASGLWFDEGSQNWLCSLQTLIKRMHLINPDIIFQDEAHFAEKQRDVIDSHYAKLGCYVVGLSATPEYPSGNPMTGHYDAMVKGKPLDWLIENDRLSAYRAFGVYTPDLAGIKVVNGEFSKGQLDDRISKDKVLMGSVVGHYKEHAMGKRHLTFATSVKRSKEFADAFNADGVPSAHMDGDTPDAERVRIINRYADGEILNLCSVDMLLFGFDLSSQVGRNVPIESMSDARPTASRTTQRQKNGRVLRYKPYPALIFDHAGNIARHGLPCQHQDYGLDGRKKRMSNGEKAPATKQCEDCFFVHPPEPTCPNCGFKYPKHTPAELLEVEAELVELQKAEAKKSARREEGMCSTLDDWMALANERGHKRGWAFHRFKNQKGR